MKDTFILVGDAARSVVEKLRPTIERIPIESREQWLALRRPDMTASAAGALLGVHEYVTAYGGLVADDPEETPAMQRGRLLEPVAIQLIRERYPHLIDVDSPGAYYRDHAARLGATPDALCFDGKRGVGVIQIKTVEPSVFRRKWVDQETRSVMPPLWIAVQGIIEAHLTGADWAAVAPMRVGFGLDLDLIDIPLHAGLIERVKTETAAFWRAVDSGQPPDPDYGRDADTIALLNQPDESLPPMDLSGDNAIHALVAEREEIGTRAKADDARKKAIDGEIAAKLAGHTVGLLADGRRITRKLQHRASYVAKATSFPVIRILGASA